VSTLAASKIARNIGEAEVTARINVPAPSRPVPASSSTSINYHQSGECTRDTQCERTSQSGRSKAERDEQLFAHRSSRMYRIVSYRRIEELSATTFLEIASGCVELEDVIDQEPIAAS
jgi:hypothetical protein